MSVLLISGPSSVPVPSLVAPRPAPGGSVTEAFDGNVDMLNPLFAANENEREIDSLLYQGLTSVGPDQQYLPALARSWALSEDHLVYTFTLRDGVRWADGRPFGLDDVIFTFSILQNPKYDQAQNAFWRDVKVDALPPNQVKFTLKAASSSFPLLLSTSSPVGFGIVAKHLFAGTEPTVVESDFHSSLRAEGTGPFMVDSITGAGTTVKLRRNPFSKPRAYLDGLVFQGYPTLADAADAVYRGDADLFGGTVGDIVPSQVIGLRKRASLVVNDMRSFTSVAVLFNLRPARVSPLTDKDNGIRIRQALVQSIDRAQLIKDNLG